MPRPGAIPATLDEGGEMILGHDNIILLGEGCRAQELSGSKLFELVVSAANDPDESDELIAQPSTMNSNELHSVINVLTDDCRWQHRALLTI